MWSVAGTVILCKYWNFFRNIKFYSCDEFIFDFSFDFFFVVVVVVHIGKGYFLAIDWFLLFIALRAKNAHFMVIL